MKPGPSIADGEFERRARVRGALLVLNALWRKLPDGISDFMVAETNLMSATFGGAFTVDHRKGKVVFEKWRKGNE